jgi:pyruvate dehydrogenase E2 component (dihydrolipoamide acetyltransferase)
MSIPFRMPALGADMEFGTLVEWKVAPGDVVARGDVVAVIETDKGAIDVEIYDAGRVERLLVETGAHVPVGEPLALIEGEPKPADTGPVPPSVAAPGGAATPAAQGPAIPRAAAPSPAAGRVKASPAARARAGELGIDLAALAGSGADGAITLDDVTRAAAGARSAAPVAERMRDVIAAAMTRSKREIPHYYLTMSVDYTAAQRFLANHNASVPVTERMLPVVPLLCAIARAAIEMEAFNGYFRDGAFQPSKAVHLGVVTALRGGGVVAPAILDAHALPAARLMHSLRDLVNRARSGHLRSAELSSGTITLTSLGDEGVDAVLPVIYPPQVAILGAGTVIERPQVVDGRIEARPTLSLALAADHRVSDGRSGARFLARIRDLLQTPERL